MSYAGFAGYTCHASQLTLMTGNPNTSMSNSPCCPVSESQSNTSTNTVNMNGNISDGPLIEPSVSSATIPPSPSSSVCTLTSPYESRLISSYPRLSGLYGSSYTDQNSFYASGTSPFYSSFGHPYDLKEANAGGWSALPQATCYPYDPTIYSPYGDRYNSMDSAARRKNATRETTNTLKAWLFEHRKNPYPTKGEKIMLAIITKMTLTQVSTWFANARRRLKKENKMTWEPRNKSSDGHDTDDKDSCKESEDNSSPAIAPTDCSNGGNKLSVKKEPDTVSEKSTVNSDINPHGKTNADVGSYQSRETEHNSHGHLHNGHDSKPLLPHRINNIHLVSNGGSLLSNHHIKHDNNPPSVNEMDPAGNNLDNLNGQRPKIWSLAQTATSESPPYSGRMPLPSTEWSTALPQGPDGLTSLSDYQRECPPPPSGMSSTLRRGPATVWPEDCVTGLGSSRSTAAAIQLFTSGPIGTASYLHSHAAKSSSSNSPFSTTNHHHHHHPFSSSMPHLVHSNHHETNAFSSAYNMSANGLRPIIDSHPCHNLATEMNENRISNGLSYNGSGHSSSKSANTFLCKVFPEYISSGPDALSLADNNSDRGGSTLSIEDSSASASSSPNLESNGSNSIKNLNAPNNTAFGLSAFRPMLKR